MLFSVQLTSSNSSWNGSWKLKLGGFSLATFVTEPLSLVCGTPYYMAPEMLMETGWARHMQLGLYQIRLNTSVSYYILLQVWYKDWRLVCWCHLLYSTLRNHAFQKVYSYKVYQSLHVIDIIAHKPQEEQHRYVCQHKVWKVLLPLPLLGPRLWRGKG